MSFIPPFRAAEIGSRAGHTRALLLNQAANHVEELPRQRAQPNERPATLLSLDRFGSESSSSEKRLNVRSFTRAKALL
jgi:hypothetical protein